ncbi:hypothetical protein GCM10007415_31450 [Parapedobacter pyrenivorans]|uniref:Thioredoxin domain-containing protein n=2 Tax=Parapedobacter pyrenivorans TaxID=1305674 RepID=A0A917HW63_9SPHI|nr:hypothetical protein GCM10007415_31450 [Parapedobacter pyrenivorans]
MAVATIMCLYAVKQVSAQEAEPAATAVADVKPLQIGDTIPEYLWHLPLKLVNHPPAGGKDSITLNDYRDKLIILDFWATWCKPCISSLYKLDTLQKQFADGLAVIPITYEEEEKAEAFITNKGWSLPSVIEEANLKKYFPHQSIPHQVWIKSGRVEAIVGPEYARANMIRDVLAGKNVAFNHKIEVPFDKMKPLFINGNGGNGSNMLYQSVISGRLQARVAGVIRPYPNEILAYNYPVEMLYKTALQNSALAPFNNDRYIIYDVDDTLRFRISQRALKEVHDDSLRSRWEKENAYCYNLVLPKGSDIQDVNERMFRDLNDFFGKYFNVVVASEDREVPALAIVKTAGYRGLSTRGGETLRSWDADSRALVLQNAPVSYLIHYMNAMLDNRPKIGLDPFNRPIVDETGIAGNVDMMVSAKFTDIGSVREALQEYGLDLAEKVTTVKMIVFKYNQQPKQ